MDFDTQFFVSIFPKLMLKIPYTLCLGCVAFAIAFVLGLFLEICFTSRFKILRTLAGLYISYFRSTPYITQLFIFYFGLPQIFPVMRNLVGGTVLVITIAMNSAALSPVSAYKEVILPQAFVAAFPSLGNSFISMIKNTAIGFTIGVVDILAQAKILAASSLNFFEAYISVGVVYWVVLVVIDRLLRYMESKICKYL